MAGTTERWRCTYDDANGAECIISVYDSEYNDDYTEVEGGGTPFSLDYMAQGDEKYAHIKAAMATIELKSSTSLQYIDVFSYANKRFTMKYTVGGAVKFWGYANPEFYSEPFMPVPYITTIKFTDGIAELKNIEFAPPGYETTDYQQHLIYYIWGAANEIGLALPIYTAVDLDFNSVGAGTVDARMLEKADIDWRSLRNEDGTFPTWYDVLLEVLISLDARIFQQGGAWIVERVDQKKTTYRVEKYTYLGVYDSTVAAQNDAVTLTSNSVASPIRFINTPCILEVAPAMKSIDILQNYGNRKNLLACNGFNGGFYADEWDTSTFYPTLKFWTQYGSGTILRPDAESNSVKVPFFSDHETDLIQCDITKLHEIIPTDNMTDFWNAWHNGEIKMRFSFEVMPIIPSVEYLSSETYTMYMLLVNQVKHNGGITFSVAWQFGSAWDSIRRGPWVLLSSAGYEDIEMRPNEWNVCDFMASTNYWYYPQVIDNDIEEVNFYVNLSPATSASATGENDYCLLRNVRLWFEKTGYDSVDNPTYDRESEYLIDNDYFLTPNTYEAKFGETPAGFTTNTGHKIINNYVILDTSGYPINYWREHGLDSMQGLIFGVNKSKRFNTYRLSRVKLRGSITDHTGTFNFRSVLVDYDGRSYIVIAATWNAKACVWDVELECIDPAIIGLKAEDFQNLLNESGGTLYA